MSGRTTASCGHSVNHPEGSVRCGRERPCPHHDHNHLTRDIKPAGECPACDRCRSEDGMSYMNVMNPTGLHAPNAPLWVLSVRPSEIVRQQQLGWPDFHPEDFCHICGHRNPIWSAPAADWSLVNGDGHAGIYCPTCWADIYEAAHGKRALWWFATFDPAETNPLQHLLDEARAEIARLTPPTPPRST